MKKLLFIICCNLSLLSNYAFGADCGHTTEVIIYKEIGDIKLDMMVVTPDNISKGELRPALVFMHGGGWKGGSYNGFKNQCEYFATKGLVCISITYRILSKHQSSPVDALMDAKSAIRYIRTNAKSLHIDPNKIITGGGSAGGQLAAAIPLCNTINDPNDDLSVSTDVAAMLLFNPAVDIAQSTLDSRSASVTSAAKECGFDTLDEFRTRFFPMHNIRVGIAPTIFMFGDNDKVVPLVMGREYRDRVEAAGGRCELKIYEGEKHSFYHIKGKDATNFYRTITDTHNFLVSLGYLDSPATVEQWLKAQAKGYFINL